MERKIINDWRQVSLRQFMEMAAMQNEEPNAEKFTEKVVGYLYGIDPMQIPYTEYLAMIAGLNNFFGKSIAEQKVSRNCEYIINGTKYVLDITPSNFTTAQYMDFTTFAKDGQRYVDMLSTVLIPDGHKYNDGYDMERTKEDVASMPVADAMGIINFFANWSKRYIATTLHFLTSLRVTKRMSKEQRRALKEKVKALSRLTASFPLS